MAIAFGSLKTHRARPVTPKAKQVYAFTSSFIVLTSSLSLSAPDLPSLKPEFYQGWQDRTSRCQGLRRQVGRLVGGEGIGAEQRDRLLLLLAAYHRLIRLPAGVSLETSPIWGAFPALLDLMEMLVDRAGPEAGALAEAVGRCREAME